MAKCRATWDVAGTIAGDPARGYGDGFWSIGHDGAPSNARWPSQSEIRDDNLESTSVCSLKLVRGHVHRAPHSQVDNARGI